MITWSGKRIKQEVKLPKFFSERYSGWKFKAATIGYDKINRCFKANLIFENKAATQPAVKCDNRVLGIDRGLYNIISTSDGFRYASNLIRKSETRNTVSEKATSVKRHSVCKTQTEKVKRIREAVQSEYQS
jgi:hypothetical protein